VWNWAKGDGGSRTEPESRVGLGCQKEFVDVSRGSWWGAGRQAQVRENLGNHGGIFDSREERQYSAALWTGGEVDGEDACEYLCQAHASLRGSRGEIAIPIGGSRHLVGLAGHDLSP